MILRIYRNRRTDFLPEADKGMYRVRVTMSSKYSMLLPIVDNVPGKRDVRILPGNDKQAFLKTLGELLAAQKRREESWLIISEPDPTAEGYDAAT